MSELIQKLRESRDKIKLKKDEVALAMISKLKDEVKDLKVRVEEKDRYYVFIEGEKSIQYVKENHIRAFIIPLVKPQNWIDNEDIKYDKVIFFCRRDFEDEFRFSTMPMDIDDFITLSMQVAFGWFVRIYTSPDSIPILLTCFTENDIKEYLKVAIEVKPLKDLVIRTLEYMYYNVKFDFTNYEAKLQQLTVLSEKERADKELLLRMFQERLSAMDTDTKENVDKKNKKILKTWEFFALGAGWALLIITLIVGWIIR